jgi:formylglycine-generating enzyme required for sulfatase activity
VALAAVILAALVAQIAVAGNAEDSGGPKAAISASVSKQLKQLKRRVAALEAQAKQPGPQGPQGVQGVQGVEGPAGSAPVCQGNGSGDTMVSAGAVCIDRYEVSVWSSPTGGTQYGTSVDDYPCNDDGHDCTNIYARSVPGVTPSNRITWYQAQQALANVGKRLPTNAEWQQAVAGTPDPGATPGSEDCNTNSGGPVDTGSRDNCSSRFGANDMVGNVHEWVADWDEQAQGPCSGFFPYGDDCSIVGRAEGDSVSTRFPGALIRGGSYGDGAGAGSFAVIAGNAPFSSVSNFGGSLIGFRGAR